MNGSQEVLEYGLSTDTFVTRKPRGEALIIGGMGEAKNKWMRVLSKHCAHVLWFRLTELLFPDKFPMVTAMAVTAPLRGPNDPTITSEVEVNRDEKTGDIEIVGIAGPRTWVVRLGDYEARRLWTALDIALYPVGWEGSSAKFPPA